MRNIFYLLLWSVLTLIPCNVKSQDLTSLFGKLGETVALNAILKNPNLQSQDMQNYIAFVNAGDRCVNSKDYDAALSNYKKASNIIGRTYDTNLKKLYYDYGWGNALNKSYNYAYSKYQQEHPILSRSNVSSGGNAGGSYYVPPTEGTSSSITTSKSRTCNLCHGSGKKIKQMYAAGKEKICYDCGGITVSAGHYHVTCDLCHGSGTLNY